MKMLKVSNEEAASPKYMFLLPGIVLSKNGKMRAPGLFKESFHAFSLRTTLSKIVSGIKKPAW